MGKARDENQHELQEKGETCIKYKKTHLKHQYKKITGQMQGWMQGSHSELNHCTSHNNYRKFEPSIRMVRPPLPI